MANCKYFYKGHQFDSEVQLDDFLIENARFEPILGDMVFSMTSAQNNTVSQLTKIRKDAKDLKEKYKQLRKEGKLKYNEDGDELLDNPPYIGVNKFLSTFETFDGTLLFPEFREEEYWKRRFANWRQGQFTETEIEEFGFQENNLSHIDNEEQMQKMREQITNRWAVQAKTGTALHNVLQIFFSRTKGQFNYEMNDIDLYNYVMNNAESQNLPFLNEKSVKQTIQYGRKLLEELTAKFGEGLAFFPEFTISQGTNQMQAGNPLQILGVIDLLIVDAQGKAHIVDYKTSVHPYADFNNVKRLSYTYQVSTYQRMLEKYGINIYSGQTLIAPIQIKGFIKKGDVYVYDGIDIFDILIEADENKNRVIENINEFMPVPFKLTVTTERLNEVVSKAMSEAFPNYSDQRKITKEQVIEELRRNKKLEPDENGLYIYPRYGYKEEPIKAKSEAEFVNKVYNYKSSLPSKRLSFSGNIKDKIKEAMKNGIDSINWPTPTYRGEDSSVDWLQDTLKPYCNGAWEVVDNSVLESYGMLLLKTRDGVIPPQVDIIRVSVNNLKHNYRQGLANKNSNRSRLTIAGQYETDLQQQSKQNSLTLQAYNGNIELIETAFVLSQTSGLEGYTIGSVKVINPITGSGMSVTNEELLWNFKELCTLGKFELPQNKILDGSIRLATAYERALSKYNSIMYEGEKKEWSGSYKNLKTLFSCKSLMDAALDGSVDDQINALTKLLKIIENDSRLGTKVKEVLTSQQDITENLQLLYNQVLLSISALKGVNFRQQVTDHGKYFQTLAVHKKGLSGSYLDNPGNLDSETLNLITKLVTEAYQNTRKELFEKSSELRKRIKKLKEAKSFSIFEENTFGNQANLYKNMIEETNEGDLQFVHPDKLVGEEKEFLIYILQEINKDRFKGCTQEELDDKYHNYDPDYFRVPLALGSTDSIASARGLEYILKEKFRGLLPKVAFDRAQAKIEGVLNYNDEESKNDQKTLAFWEMTNMFDHGLESSKRMDVIQKYGIHSFERNLETLLLKHQFAYSVQNNMNKVFPTMKAAAIHLASQGAMQNTKFSNDLEYYDKYIKNKILNKSIIDPKLQSVMGIANNLKSAASKFTLAFAPVQALYQPLQGLWQSIRIIISKPNGEQTFSFGEWWNATKIVYSNLAHFSDEPTVLDAINAIYGINDMDINVFTERISSAKKGIWNMENLMFKFASRPDFYNRMSIVVAQMIHDGNFDALSMKDGKLVYDWKKDKRFDAFANGNKSNITKYNQQKSLYYTIAKQFISEHTKNPDDTDFVLNMSNPQALPLPYTNREIESIKSLADDIYGYYSHEKKSLVQSTALGCMWLQFKTYWSGKKNQYLQSGGVRLRGSWEQMEVNGQKYYYQVDSDGNPIFDTPPTTEDTGFAFMQWQGRWQEGIILTLSEIAQNMWNEKSIMEGWRVSMNEIDPKILEVRLANLKHFFYELNMSVLGGIVMSNLLAGWLKDLEDDNKYNEDFMTGLALASARIGVMSVTNSFMDMNFFDSVGSPLYQWTPFAFEWGSRTMKNWWNVATGDEDFWDGVIKTSSALRQIKPVLDTIKPDFWKTEREGGTFGKK